MMAKRSTTRIRKTSGKARTTTQRQTQVPPHLVPRIRQAQARLGELDLPAMLVTNPVDVRYLTGFVGDDSWALVRRNTTAITVISDTRFQEQIGREAPHVKTAIRKKSLIDELEKLVKRHKLAKLGLQAARITVGTRNKIADRIGKKAVADIDDQLLGQRAVKDDDEVRTIGQALKIQQEAFRQTLAFIEPGKTEVEIAAYLEYQMRTLGADGPSFNTIVAADANASLPHAIPGKKKVRKNGLVLIDWGARYQGYCGDLTRVVLMGKAPAKMREVYQVVLDAKEKATAAIAPGNSVVAIDKIARDHIAKAGYGDYFGHSLGHGIGLEIHEQPGLSPRGEGELQPGHVVTVEPGIYLPGQGGVRLEDDVLVTQSGHRVLSDLPADLESATL